MRNETRARSRSIRWHRFVASESACRTTHSTDITGLTRAEALTGFGCTVDTFMLAPAGQSDLSELPCGVGVHRVRRVRVRSSRRSSSTAEDVSRGNATIRLGRCPIATTEQRCPPERLSPEGTTRRSWTTLPGAFPDYLPRHDVASTPSARSDVGGAFDEQPAVAYQLAREQFAPDLVDCTRQRRTRTCDADRPQAQGSCCLPTCDSRRTSAK